MRYHKIIKLYIPRNAVFNIGITDTAVFGDNNFSTNFISWRHDLVKGNYRVDYYGIDYVIIWKEISFLRHIMLKVRTFCDRSQ